MNSTVVLAATPAWLPLFAVWVVIASVVALVAHGRDKRAAIRGRRRTPEARLHLYELLGGWPGALLGMSLFRHKTRKASYLAVTAMIVVAWLAAGIWFAVS